MNFMKKMVFSSDYHITDRNSPRYQLLCRWLNHAETQNAETVVLLGDIFELMVGNFSEYTEEFPEFFKLLEALLIKGTDVYYCEGNHDFHLTELFMRRLGFRHYPVFHLVRGCATVELGVKKVVIGHGDFAHLNTFIYGIYRLVLRSLPLRLLTDHIFTYQRIKNIAAVLAENSKKNKKVVSRDSYQKLIREKIEEHYNDSNVDFIIYGHTHLEDDFTFSAGMKRYINSGCAMMTDQFFSLDETGKLEKIHLNE